MTGRELLMEQQRARMEARRARRRLEKFKKQQKAQQKKVVRDLRSDPAPPSKPSNASKNTGTSKTNNVSKNTRTPRRNNSSNSASQANNNSGKLVRPNLKGLEAFGKKSGKTIGNKEGDTKTVNGRKFVYRGGSWKPDYRY